MRDNKKGQLAGTLGLFIIVSAVLILLVLLLFTFNTLDESFESTKIARSATNESDSGGSIAFLNQTGYTVVAEGYTGDPRDFVITAVWGDGNQSGGYQANISNTPTGYTSLIAAGNYSINSTTGIVRNASSYNFPNVSISYTFNNNSASQAATETATTSASNAVPLVGILFVVIAIGAVISILVGSFLRRKRA